MDADMHAQPKPSMFEALTATGGAGCQDAQCQWQHEHGGEAESAACLVAAARQSYRRRRYGHEEIIPQWMAIDELAHLRQAMELIPLPLPSPPPPTPRVHEIR